MMAKTLRGKGECSLCGRLFTSWRRMQHHRAAEHAPKTSEDIGSVVRLHPRKRHRERRTAVKSITELKGLHDVRTVISAHTRSASRHKGTPYLEIMSLGMEKLRLDTELARLTRFRTRIEGRLDEIRDFMEDRLNTVREEDSAANGSPAESTRGNRAQGGAGAAPRNWRTMKVEY